MKELKTKLLFLLLSGVLIFSSCSNSSNPSTPANYFPYKLGNTWIYDYYKLDSTQNHIDSTHEWDSMAVIRTEVLFGHTANVVLDTMQDGTSSTSDFYVDSNKLYASSSFLTPNTGGFPIGQLLNITPQWFLIADPTATSWQVFTQAINNVKITLPTVGDVTFNGTYTINGSKGGTANYTVNGKVLTCQEFTITFTVTGTATISILPLSINFSLPYHLWFADGIGLVRSQFEWQKIGIPSSTPLYSFDVPGTEDMLKSYYIATTVTK